MMKLYGKEPSGWIVALSQIGDKVHVYLTEYIEPNPEFEAQRVADLAAGKEPKAREIPRTNYAVSYTVKPKHLGKTIEKVQKKADEINQEEQDAWDAMLLATEVDKYRESRLPQSRWKKDK